MNMSNEECRERAVYDPTSASFQQDPFPALHKLRRLDPVHLTRTGWVLTRHEDCAMVLSSQNFGMKGIASMLERTLGRGAAYDVVANRFHSFDPPEHTRLRRLVSYAFTARRVRELEAKVSALAEPLLDSIGGREAFDLVESFSYPLPLLVITEILGTPMEDRVRIGTWTDQILRAQGDFGRGGRVLDEGNAAAEEFMKYMRALVAVRRKHPGDDVLSALIHAQEGNDTLSDEEVAECVVFLANAGHSTTRHLIGSAVIALLENPSQRDMLARDPSLIDDVVEEALRYNCSLTGTLRFAREETVIGDRRIAAGAAVYCLLNAANRDPARFPDPDRFDMKRADKKHLAFGGGVHRCLGLALAQMQIKTALSALVRRYPTMILEGKRIEWHGGLYRGPVRVPLLARS